jgi:hypothetical protein
MSDLETVIADLIKRKNAAREGSAERRMLERELTGPTKRPARSLKILTRLVGAVHAARCQKWSGQTAHGV